jgi:hypothetical protein
MTSVMPKRAEMQWDLQAAEKLDAEGGWGFNPSKKPAK